MAIAALGIVLAGPIPAGAGEAKLESAKLGESERQVRDVKAVARATSASLDLAYLRAWAAELGLLPDLEHILRQGSSIRGCLKPRVGGAT